MGEGVHSPPQSPNLLFSGKDGLFQEQRPPSHWGFWVVPRVRLNWGNCWQAPDGAGCCLTSGQEGHGAGSGEGGRYCRPSGSMAWPLLPVVDTASTGSSSPPSLTGLLTLTPAIPSIA